MAYAANVQRHSEITYFFIGGKMKKNLNIKTAIWICGISQADLARLANISSEARLSRIINGRIKPTEEEISRLAAALHTHLGKEDFEMFGGHQ